MPAAQLAAEPDGRIGDQQALAAGSLRARRSFRRARIAWPPVSLRPQVSASTLARAQNSPTSPFAMSGLVDFEGRATEAVTGAILRMEMASC
jgi:hypothetical protein